MKLRYKSFILLLFLFSCASKRDYLVNENYKDFLKKYTREGKYYESMETRLIALATYKSTDFMRAQVNKVGKDLLYDDETIKIQMVKAERSNEFNINFFVALYTPDTRFADFSKDKGLWKFYIEKDGKKPIEANKIKVISKMDLPNYEPLYPYIASAWMTCYEISFYKSDLKDSTGAEELSPPFNLIITGKIGKISLLFN